MSCRRTKNKRLSCQLGFSRRMRKWDMQKCLLLIQVQYLITWARTPTRLPLQALIDPLDSLSPTNPLMIHHRTLLAKRPNTFHPLHHKE
jgi:hypothetical protein